MLRLHLLHDELPWLDFQVQLRIVLLGLYPAVMQALVQVVVDLLCDAVLVLPTPASASIGYDVDVAAFHAGTNITGRNESHVGF